MLSKIELLGPKLDIRFDKICLCIEMNGGQDKIVQ